MKVVFVSNYYNHHQSPFSRKMYALTDGEYRFIATEPMEEERLKMGWGGESDSFVLEYSKDEKLCRQLIDGAEVVIIGSAPESLVKNRLVAGKLTFKYSERLYKNSLKAYTLPIRFVKNYFRFAKYKNYYLLCASAYAAEDYAKTLNFINKSFKWGYFPEVKRYESEKNLIAMKKGCKSELLWVARFIDWKHPEQAVLLAERLKKAGYDFTLNMIGNGEMEEKIGTLVKEKNLSDCVHLLGAMKPAEVREYMERANIFLFTSDRNEGWGAVLNESMNSGCAVCANKDIGSVPYLIKDGENGFVFTDENELFEKVKALLDNPESAEDMGLRAYKTLTETWNADVVAERFLRLCNELKTNPKADLFDEGPLSKE